MKSKIQWLRIGLFLLLTFCLLGAMIACTDKDPSSDAVGSTAGEGTVGTTETTGTDASTETVTETVTETDSETVAATQTESASDIETVTETETVGEPETETETDTETDTESKTETDTETETESETETETETETDVNTVIASFAVFSDVHIGKNNVSPLPEAKFADVLTQLKTLLPDCDAVLFAGDITNLGTDAEYESFMKLWNENKPEGAQLGAVIGNHEYFRDGVVRYGGESKRFLIECQKAFETIVGEQNVDMVVGGVHMIGVSADNSAAQYTSSEQFIIDHVKAAAEEDPTKPIILFAHEGAGMFYGAGGGVYTEATLATLRKYPQIICFSGHTHLSLYDPRMIQQKDFTTIQTSTSGADLWNYPSVDPDQPKGKDNVSEGLLVTVTAGGVVTVTRYDFFRKTTIGEPWVIDIPAVIDSRANFTYTNKRKSDAADPVFPQDGVVAVTDITTTGVNVAFPAATVEDKVSDGQICKYVITAVKEGASAPSQTREMQGEYYLGKDASASYTLPLTGLRSGTTYTVTVTAETPWGKTASITSTAFTTAPSLSDGSDENLALDKKVTASGSAYDAEGWGIAMLTDGSIMQTSVDGTNGWMSNGVKNRTDPTWACIDLGEVCAINRVVVYPRKSGERFPVGYYFEVSVDGRTWAKVAEETADPYTLDARSFDFETTDARYVRITTTELHADSYVGFANGYMAQISEIEIYMIKESDKENIDAKVPKAGA